MSQIDMFGHTDKVSTRGAATRAELRMIEDVFVHWMAVMQFDRPRKLTKDRRSRILARLREGYTVEQLWQVAETAATQPFWRGQNRWNKPFDDISNIYKHAARVDMFLALKTSELEQESMMARDEEPDAYEL